MSAHTPGPWPVVRELDFDGSDDGMFVERIGPFHIEWHDDLNKGNPERIEADIALFAAAPYLLEALQRAVKAGIIDIDGEPELASAAIAKATGSA